MRLITIDVRSIEVGERIRKQQKASELRELAESLESEGQIQPIVLQGNTLVAGFRRWAATGLLLHENKGIGHRLPETIQVAVTSGDDDTEVAENEDEIETFEEQLNPRRLEPGQILAVQYEHLSPLDQLRIELEENRKRSQFSKAEEALGIERIRKLMEQTEGKKVTDKQIAQRMGVSRAHVTMGLKVAKAVEGGRKELLQSNSVFGAYQMLNSIEKMEKRKREAALNKGPVKGEGLFNGDTVEWIKTVENESVDFWHFDPPWGIDIDSYDRNDANDDWDDDKMSAQQLTVALVPELYRTLKPDSYMVMWFGIQFYEEIRSLLIRNRFHVDPVPAIWFKPDKGGSQNDPSRHLLNVYEPFFIVKKGDPRMFKQAQTNVLSYPMPSRTERIHRSQKNVDLLVDVLERYTFGNMVVGDPTFGSGAIFKAADRLGRPIIGAEQSPTIFEKAVLWLNEFKTLDS